MTDVSLAIETEQGAQAQANLGFAESLPTNDEPEGQTRRTMVGHLVGCAPVRRRDGGVWWRARGPGRGISARPGWHRPRHEPAVGDLADQCPRWDVRDDPGPEGERGGGQRGEHVIQPRGLWREVADMSRSTWAGQPTAEPLTSRCRCSTSCSTCCIARIDRFWSALGRRRDLLDRLDLGRPGLRVLAITQSPQFGAPPGCGGAGRPEKRVQARSIAPQKKCTG